MDFIARNKNIVLQHFRVYRKLPTFIYIFRVNPVFLYITLLNLYNDICFADMPEGFPGFPGMSGGMPGGMSGGMPDGFPGMPGGMAGARTSPPSGECPGLQF